MGDDNEWGSTNDGGVCSGPGGGGGESEGLGGEGHGGVRGVCVNVRGV